LEKIIIKKIIWENTATIHSVLKKKNYKAKFLISSILKKINRDNFRKNNKKNQKRRKKSCWKHYINSQCFIMKVTVLPHMI
jgi:hypothetical protein